MKALFLSVSLCLYATVNLAGQTKLGLIFNYAKGTASSANIQLGNQANVLEYDFVFKEQADVMAFGISSKTDIGSFFIKTDVLFRKTSYLYELTNYTERSLERTTEHRNEYQLVHIPISAGIKFQKLYAGLGPIMNIVLDSTIDDELNNTFRIKERNKYFGFQFLFGVQMTKNIGLEVKYENTFSNVSDGYYHKDSPVNIKSSPNLFTMSTNVYF